MSFATSLRDTARTLITTFGTSVSLYVFSSATKTETDEGDITVTDWKTATTPKCVIGEELSELDIVTSKGLITNKTATVIFRDDVTIAVNDRITLSSKEYRVDSLDTSNRVDGVLIVQSVTMTVR